MQASKKYIYLEKLLFSSRENDILRFYSNFKSPKELVHWMEKRPRQKFKIYEVNGDKRYTVIIPTRNYLGSHARRCLKIYKGLHIIFLESHGAFFSYSRTINYGFKYAVKKYDPNWIIVSNDDMLKVDNVLKLKNQLDKLNRQKVDVVYVSPGKQQSVKSYLVSPRITYRLYQILFNKCSKIAQRILDKFGARLFIISCNNDSIKSQMLKLLRPLLFRTYREFTSLGSCWIINSDFVRKQRYKVLDDNFIIDTEEDEFVLRHMDNIRASHINYKIDNYFGASLGSGCARSLKGLTGIIYLNYKFSK